ncbi:MAG TPA: PadR family transcriptional regulator [Bryobacteraceae bacterium]|nr:PadR family transcriptional regulator [Bryobacteraceae bacterium]
MRDSGRDFQGADWAQWAFGPWGRRRGRFFEAGEVRLAVLSLLAENPRHGYDLMKELETRSGGTYKVSAGTMYPTLQQLEDEGLIVSEQQDGRRVYQITAAGRTELEAQKAKVEEIWKRAERWEDWGRWMGPEAFAMAAGPLGNLAKTIMRAVKRSGGRREFVEQIREIVDRAAREVEELEKRL